MSVIDKARRSAHGLDSTGDPWQLRAACASRDPAMFIRSHSETGLGRGRAALRICAQCPVLEPCHRWAGGLQPVQRLDLIVGGEVYDRNGEQAKRCPVCRRPVLGDVRATYCESHDWYSAQQAMQRTERAERIRQAAAAGKSLRAIALEEGLSFQRIGEILREAA